MKTRLHQFFLILGVTAVCLPLPAAPDRFERTKSQIEALLKPRLHAEPLPAKPANPFLFTLPGSAVVDQPQRPVNALADDDQILAYCAARLRIGGVVQIGSRSHLLINSATYKEGDLIPVRGTGETVYYVKILRITNEVVIFGYNEAVITLPLRT